MFTVASIVSQEAAKVPMKHRTKHIETMKGHTTEKTNVIQYLQYN
jgi:hypothetical protein